MPEEHVSRFGSWTGSAEVDNSIQEAQRCIVEALDLDGSTLFDRSDDGDLHATHGWWRPEVPAPPAQVLDREHFPWMFGRVTAGELVIVSSAADLPDGVDRASLRRFDLKSIVVVPVALGQRIVGVVSFGVMRDERQWPPELLHRLRLAANIVAGPLVSRHRDNSPRLAPAPVSQVATHLRSAELARRREADSTVDTSRVGQSAAIRRVEEQVRQVAQTDTTVLLLGETGSGKEVFASQIHQLSRRRDREMVRVNCAAIPATLIESELFGREKGAYTGALTRQVGRFELADRSTIFLDEIGDLPIEVQVKLLRVLEDRQIERLGSSKVTRFDARIIAATHRDLEKRIAADTFREDLYYRLNVYPIRVPSLRERAEDIPLLVWRFVEDFSAAFGKRVESIPKDNMEMLQRYDWPGNVRELRNLVERAVIGANGPRLIIALPPPSSTSPQRSVRLADWEREHIKGVLDSTRWQIRGLDGAAAQLGLKATTLETRMVKLGLHRP